MKKTDPFITHIYQAISKIEEYTEGIDKESFFDNSMIEDAVIRQIEIIGEAVTHLENEFKDKYPDIPWQVIKDMRNNLTHEYWDVDLDKVWLTVQKDIPELKSILQPYFDQINPDELVEGWDD